MEKLYQAAAIFGIINRLAIIISFILIIVKLVTPIDLSWNTLFVPWYILISLLTINITLKRLKKWANR